MRKNHDITHLWANDTRADKRRGNMHCVDGRLYSYNAVIGQHVTIGKRDPKTATLLSTRSYSVTTAQHQSAASQAALHLNTIRVPDIPSEFTYGNIKAGAKVLYDLWLREVGYEADKLKTARKPENYLDAITRYGEQIEKFALWSGTKIPAKLRTLIDMPKSEDWRAIVAAQADKLRKAKAKKKAEQTKENAIAITQWRETGRLEYNPDTDAKRWAYRRVDRDYLRYNNQTERIETTQHVQVPVRLARELYDWLKVTRANGGCSNVTACNYRFMNSYDVRAVNDQYFEIGCHTVYFDEVERIANSLGWDRVAYLVHESEVN